MAVTARGTPTYADGNGATSLSPNKPTGTASGDIIILTCAGQNGVTTDKTSTGFTHLGKGNMVGGSGFVSHVLARIADGSEGASFTVNSDAGDNWWVTCSSWQGAAAALPTVGTWAGSGSQTTLTVTGITLTAAGLVLLASDCFGNPDLPSGWAQAANPTAGEGQNKSELFSKSFSAGATGSQNITEGGGGWMHGVMIGLNEPAAASTPSRYYRRNSGILVPHTARR